tara:strand:- start:61 stop:1191 length:1131 start_codon:yes stop_codon:yes gene_type:complete
MTDLFRGPYELKIDSHKFDFIFPKKTDNLRITDIALYSMILSVYSKYMVRLLKNIYFNYSIDMKDLNIFDLGSNIGGTLYYFLREAKSVTGIEYEPLHVDITWHNLNKLNSKEELKKLKLIYGDVEKIFMKQRINTSEAFHYNGEFTKLKNTDIHINNNTLFYIGIPFIDLSFGSTSVSDVILHLDNQYSPISIVVQIPCSIQNNYHEEFYNKNLPILLEKIKSKYDIKFFIDIKKNYGCSNLHLILIKKNKKKIMKFKKKYVVLKHNIEFEKILNQLINKFNIECIVKRFNINSSWKPVYYSSYYSNGYLKNSTVYLETFTRGTNKLMNVEQIKIPVTDNVLLKKIKDIPRNKIVKCDIKYDRFTDKLKDIQLLE